MVGVPIDVEMLTKLRDHWEAIQDDLIAAIDINYSVYEGRPLSKASIGGERTSNYHLAYITVKTTSYALRSSC